MGPLNAFSGGHLVWILYPFLVLGVFLVGFLNASQILDFSLLPDVWWVQIFSSTQQDVYLFWSSFISHCSSNFLFDIIQFFFLCFLGQWHLAIGGASKVKIVGALPVSLMYRTGILDHHVVAIAVPYNPLKFEVSSVRYKDGHLASFRQLFAYQMLPSFLPWACFYHNDSDVSCRKQKVEFNLLII